MRPYAAGILDQSVTVAHDQTHKSTPDGVPTSIPHGTVAWVRRIVDRHLVPAFVVATYAWTWSVGVPVAAAAHGIGHAHRSLGALTLAGFAPTIVALALLAIARGRIALRDVGSRLVHARVPLDWYALAVLGPLAVIGTCRLVLPLVGAPLPALGPWYTPLLGVLPLIPLTGFFEEVGWRGLMLDELQQRMSQFRASLLVAASWGFWHVPTYLRLMPEGDRTMRLQRFVGTYEGGQTVSLVKGQLVYQRRIAQPRVLLVPLPARSAGAFAAGDTRYDFEVNGESARLRVTSADGVESTYARVSLAVRSPR